MRELFGREQLDRRVDDPPANDLAARVADRNSSCDAAIGTPETGERGGSRGIEGEPIQVGSRRPGPLDDPPENPRQSFP